MDGGTAITGSSKQKLKQMLQLDRKQCSTLESVKSNMLRYFVISVTFLRQGLRSGSIHGLQGPRWSEIFKIGWSNGVLVQPGAQNSIFAIISGPSPV